MEFGGTAGAKICDLLWGDCGDLTSAAGVSGVGLEGEEGWRRTGGGEAEREGEGFVVEMAVDEEGLEV